MKIEYVEGDLFDTDIPYIVHGCNAQGVMGSGIAKLVKEKYPAAYIDYIKRHKISGWRVGEIGAVKSNGKTIINAITQEFYGRDGARYVNYEALAVAMEQINDMFYTIPNGRLAMPKIGAGLAGGDWNVISAIIESELVTVQPVVYWRAEDQ